MFDPRVPRYPILHARGVQMPVGRTNLQMPFCGEMICPSVQNDSGNWSILHRWGRASAQNLIGRHCSWAGPLIFPPSAPKLLSFFGRSGRIPSEEMPFGTLTCQRATICMGLRHASNRQSLPPAAKRTKMNARSPIPTRAATHSPLGLQRSPAGD